MWRIPTGFEVGRAWKFKTDDATLLARTAGHDSFGDFSRHPTVYIVEYLRMNRAVPSRVEMLQGTLDLLILQTLRSGPAHGHAIAKYIQRTSEDLLQVETGSLYPALHRLEAKGWIAASWHLSDKGKRAKYYKLTPAGRKQLAAEHFKWTAFSRAVSLILNPAG